MKVPKVTLCQNIIWTKYVNWIRDASFAANGCYRCITIKYKIVTTFYKYLNLYTFLSKMIKKSYAITIEKCVVIVIT